jgi:hypothetical protein
VRNVSVSFSRTRVEQTQPACPNNPSFESAAQEAGWIESTTIVVPTDNGRPPFMRTSPNGWQLTEQPWVGPNCQKDMEITEVLADTTRGAR